MAVALDKGKLAFASVLSLLAAGSWRCGEERKVMAEAMVGKDKANQLVQNWGKRLGVPSAQLGPDNDRSFGESGFHYDPNSDILTGRVFVMKLNSYIFGPQVAAKARSAMKELNSPKIVPLFERAGGYFEFDEDKDMLFLKKQFPVAKTGPGELREQMDELSDVGAKWTFRWYKWAMQIIYGRTQPPRPPLPVTRGNDAQHSEFRR